MVQAISHARSLVGPEQQLHLSWDNARIHRLPAGYDLAAQNAVYHPLPPLSPDLHQMIEHVFGELKQYIAQHIYAISRVAWMGSSQEGRAEHVRQAVVKWCEDKLKPEHFHQSLQRLQDCYRVVAAPIHQQVQVGDRTVAGTGGDYPPKHFR